jgi:hypothetical protein
LTLPDYSGYWRVRIGSKRRDVTSDDVNEREAEAGGFNAEEKNE